MSIPTSRWPESDDKKQETRKIDIGTDDGSNTRNEFANSRQQHLIHGVGVTNFSWLGLSQGVGRALRQRCHLVHVWCLVEGATPTSRPYPTGRRAFHWRTVNSP